MKKILLVAALAAASTSAFAAVADDVAPATVTPVADNFGVTGIINNNDRSRAYSGTRAEKQQGTVNFYGEVIKQTCKIKSGTENQNVTLPKVATGSLDQVGRTAGDTGFTIYFDGCTNNTNHKISAAFINNSTYVDQNTGYLKNQLDLDVPADFLSDAGPDSIRKKAEDLGITYSTNAAGAKGVEIMIADQQGKAIPLNGAANYTDQFVAINNGPSNSDSEKDGTASQTYIARYVAVSDAVEAGVVKATIEYNIVYN